MKENNKRKKLLLRGVEIKKDYGIQTVLDIKKLEIFDGDRIGLVGRNGTGKSTLLSVLSGRELGDSGSIQKNCEIAEVLQSREDGQTLQEETEGMYISQMKIRDSAIKSGGEKTRLALAAAFSKHAPLLFADEPTTNLDAAGIETVEKMLSGYRGAILLVSHDRALLDHVCNQIWELEDGSLRIFQGTYSEWTEQKLREHNFQQFEYEQYRTEKKRLEKVAGTLKQEAQRVGKPPKRMSSSEWILYKGTAAIQQGHAQGRVRAVESRLSHLEVKERPKEIPTVSMKLSESQRMKAKITTKVENLSVSFLDKVILENVSMQIERGKKTFLVGENGSGKSTIVENIINRREHTFITSEAKVGYFSQEQNTLDFGRTVLENVRDTAVVPEHVCRAVLSNLYMSKEDVFKKLSVLSGGERVKTALAKVLVSGCNFLVLDEPANHIDIYTMEGLERLLESYDGTALIVSHDRKMVENLADVVYEVKDGSVIRY